MIGKKIKDLRNKKEITQEELGKIIGVTTSMVGMYETGTRNPSYDVLQKIADYFETTTDYLLGRNEFMHVAESVSAYSVNTNTLHPVPILGVIRAGAPIRAEQNIIGHEYLPEVTIQGGEYFGLRVTGDSMNGSRINEGDVVIVREQPDVENGEIAVVLVDGENATVKKFYKTDTMVTLMPDSLNKEHQPRFIDITKETVKVLGKVVKVIINI